MLILNEKVTGNKIKLADYFVMYQQSYTRYKCGQFYEYVETVYNNQIISPDTPDPRFAQLSP
jgi:hypothetical protein